MAEYTTIELKERDATTFNGAYQTLGTVLANPCYGLVIDNLAKVPAYISFDGSTDHIHIGSEQVLEIIPKMRDPNFDKGVYMLPKGTQLYIKAANSTGYVSVMALTTS